MKVVFSLEIFDDVGNKGCPEYITEMDNIPREGEIVTLPDEFMEKAKEYSLTKTTNSFPGENIFQSWKAYREECGLSQVQENTIEDICMVDFVEYDLGKDIILIGLKFD